MTASAYDFINPAVNKWNSSIITYTYDSSFYGNVSDDAHKQIHQLIDSVSTGTVSNGNSTLGDAAIHSWEAILPIDFQPAAVATDAQIGMITRNVNGGYSGANQPILSGNSYSLEEIAIKSTGTLGLYVHELGHALGLDHPLHGDGSAAGFDTETTIMSYNPSAITLNHPAVTPMIYDILAAQIMYGANTDTLNHSDTYYLNSSLSQSSTIWDAGGTGIDTLTVNNTASTTAATIDLRGGIDPSTGKPFWSHFGGEYRALAFNPGESSGNVTGLSPDVPPPMSRAGGPIDAHAWA